MKGGRVITRTAKECRFGYRDSIFKHAKGAAHEIILSATLVLAKGDKKEIAKAIRAKIEYRTKNHPLEHPNIGSIFKNVPLVENHFTKSATVAGVHLAKQRYRSTLEKNALEYKGSHFSVKTDPFPVISAAKLISDSGLRGVSFGGAMISAKHPNFIVTVLDAGASEVRNLIALAKFQVKRKFGIDLQEEVQIV